MSALLIQEQFIAYLPSLAKKLGGIPEAVMLQAIWFKADKGTGELVMSRAELADYIGASERSIGRYAKALRELGVLSYDGRARKGYDKTTRWVVHPEKLDDSTSPDLPTGVGAKSQSAPTGFAGSGGSEGPTGPDLPTPVGTQQSATMTHSQSANLTHSSTLKEEKSPPPTSSTDDEGFREFWGRYPDTGYKGRKEECRRIWKSMSIEDRRDTWYALGAYLNSELWMNRDKIPSPLNWLESEPALALRGRNLPPQRLSPQNEWMRNG